MAKDPAFLFYSGDFMMGTALMSEAEVGQYIRILCHMHQSGHLSMEDMNNICPNISYKVVAKFTLDMNGKYFNARLEKEVSKRKAYSESRRNNRLKDKSKSYDKTHDQSYDVAVSTHMENENRNENRNEVKKGVQGEDPEFTDYEAWTEDIIAGKDWLFNDKIRNMGVKVNGHLQEYARSHLALLAKYPKMKPSDQQRFRVSLIGHINEKLKHEDDKAKGNSRTTSAIIDAGKDYSAGL